MLLWVSSVTMPESSFFCVRLPWPSVIAPWGLTMWLSRIVTAHDIVWAAIMSYQRSLTDFRFFKFKYYNCLHDLGHMSYTSWLFASTSIRLFLNINVNCLTSRTVFKPTVETNNIKILFLLRLPLLLSTALYFLKKARPSISYSHIF